MRLSGSAQFAYVAKNDVDVVIIELFSFMKHPVLNFVCNGFKASLFGVQRSVCYLLITDHAV
jgi:hypothetical protein